MLNIKTVVLATSTFFGLSYIFCVLFGLMTPDSLHMHQFLENVLPGFKWLTISGFFIGLVESIGWGLYISFVFVLIYNFVHKKIG